MRPKSGILHPCTIMISPTEELVLQDHPCNTKPGLGSHADLQCWLETPFHRINFAVAVVHNWMSLLAIIAMHIVYIQSYHQYQHETNSTGFCFCLEQLHVDVIPCYVAMQVILSGSMVQPVPAETSWYGVQVATMLGSSKVHKCTVVKHLQNANMHYP